MINVALLGATGRMGKTLVRAIVSASDLSLSGALAAQDDPALGADAGTLAGVAAQGVAVSPDLAVALDGAQVAIDFTLPSATSANVSACTAAGVPLVIGTTGISEEDERAIAELSRKVPVMRAPNMSVGVNLSLKLAELAGQVLGQDYDIDILEAHHRHKIDAPSGTALKLGEVVARGRGVRLEDVAEYARHGHTGPRKAGTIAFSCVRAGDIVGEHSLIFSTEGERIEINHKASDRMTFARGALRAARWVVRQPPGLYGMGDVLGL